MSKRRSFYGRISGFQHAITFLLSFVAFQNLFHHAHSQSSTCTKDSECGPGQFCDLTFEECRTKWLSKCTSEFKDDWFSICGQLAENGTIVPCSFTSLTDEDPFPCFVGRPGSNSCPLHTTFVNASSQLPQERNCAPCKHIETFSNEKASKSCYLDYKFKRAGEKTGEPFNSCKKDEDCALGLYCYVLVLSVSDDWKRSIFDSSNQYSTSVVDGFCFKNSDVASFCTTSLLCHPGESCVRFKGIEDSFCAPTVSISRVQPPLQVLDPVPRWTLRSLAATELAFILLKSVAMTQQKKSWAYCGLLFFIIESLAGLAITALQFVLLISVANSDGYSLSGPRLIIMGGVSFVVTEILSIISESLIIRRRVTGQTATEIDLSTNKFSFSLVRRVVSKVLVIVIVISMSVYTNIRSWYIDFEHPLSSYAKPAAISMIAILTIYTIASAFLYKRFWVRIVLSNIILLLSVVVSLLFLFPQSISGRSEKYLTYVNWCNPIDSTQTAVPSFLFSVIIFMNALSAFRLHGYQESNGLTAEQVEFVESAALGLGGSVLTISTASNPCPGAKILVLLVGGPQIAVLLSPFLAEYIFVAIKKLRGRSTS